MAAPGADYGKRLLALAAARAAGDYPEWQDRPRRPKDRDFGEIALDTATDIGMGIARPVLTGLEYIGRPWAAAVEAYGAAEAGKDALRAAKRVLTKGIEKRKYPTVGERLLPVEEDEGLGRVAARIGIEAATDPTMWLGPAAVRGVGGLAVKGARAAAATAPAQAIAHSTAAQQLSRMLLPSMQNLAFFGKKYGGAVGGGIQRATNTVEELSNREIHGLAQTVARLKLGGAGNEGRRKLAANMLRSGSVDSRTSQIVQSSGDEAVDELATYMSRRLNVLGRMVRRYRDRYDKGVEITRTLTKDQKAFIKEFASENKLKRKDAIRILAEAGEAGLQPGSRLVNFSRGTYATPFQMEANYFPQMLKDEFLQKALTTSGFNNAVADLAKSLKISTQQARGILERQTGRVKKAGHIEHARTQIIPNEMLELDPLKVLPRYTNQTLHRLAMGREFGLSGKRAQRLLQRAQDVGLKETTAQDAMNVIRGQFQPSAFGLDKIAPKLLGFQVLSKMGPTSAIAQLSQNINTLVSEGVGNYSKGLIKLMSQKDPSGSMWQRSAETFHGAMRSQIQQLMGTPDAGGLIGRWISPGTYLRYTGFTPADQLARRTAYAAGVASAETLARAARKQGKLITSRLTRMGLKDSDVAYFHRAGKFSPGAERRVGLLAAEKTQFLNRFTDLPPLWQTPEFRLATQFKSFIYQQSRFILREVMTPAMKYFETGGKQGSIGPLMRALALFPAGGQGVAASRDLLAEMSAQAIGARRRAPRKFDYNHPVAQMVKDMTYVGAFGLAGDAFQQAARGKFVEFALGPTASDVVGWVQFGAQKLAKGEPPSMEELGRKLYPHLPFRRVLPLQPREVIGALR